MTKLLNYKRFSSSFSLKDVGHLMFPELCLICADELSNQEKHICTICASEIHRTNYHFFSDPTPMDKLFWGRISIEKTYTHLFFHGNDGTRKILFALKYHNNPYIGKYFGKQIAETISGIDAFNTVDAFIPVPLHPKKQFIRGYNQSEYLANGISEGTGKPIDIKSVQRAKHSASQTKKSRFQRWENVHGLFRVSSSIKQYQHIALVDDVVTTGSTIESITQSIRAVHPNIKISIVTLAIA